MKGNEKKIVHRVLFFFFLWKYFREERRMHVIFVVFKMPHIVDVR